VVHLPEYSGSIITRISYYASANFILIIGGLALEFAALIILLRPNAEATGHLAYNEAK